MKLPRDWSGIDLASRLTVLGYTTTRQSGSHIRLSTARNGQHHVTVPARDPLKVGTLSAVLAEVAAHHRMTRDQLIQLLG
jgi:predicted RNA binding protein YcfA (HicA-like mRNA interferase family)